MAELDKAQLKQGFKLGVGIKKAIIRLWIDPKDFIGPTQLGSNFALIVMFSDAKFKFIRMGG